MTKQPAAAQQEASTKARISADGAGENGGTPLKMTIPTGRIQEKVLLILKQVGVNFSTSGRSYKPVCKDAGIQAKMLKGQNIPALVALGRHDCGFCGYDWTFEQQADVVELLDLEFDP